MCKSNGHSCRKHLNFFFCKDKVLHWIGDEWSYSINSLMLSLLGHLWHLNIYHFAYRNSKREELYWWSKRRVILMSDIFCLKSWNSGLEEEMLNNNLFFPYYLLFFPSFLKRTDVQLQAVTGCLLNLELCNILRKLQIFFFVPYYYSCMFHSNMKLPFLAINILL